MVLVSPIRNDQDLEKALQEFSDLMDLDPEKGTPEGDKFEILAVLITDYENKHYPIEAPDPIEAIKNRMAEQGLKQKDLIEIIGHESKVSEVLNRKRKLTLEMIRRISASLNISLSTLVQDYQLVK